MQQPLLLPRQMMCGGIRSISYRRQRLPRRDLLGRLLLQHLRPRHLQPWAQELEVSVVDVAADARDGLERGGALLQKERKVRVAGVR